METATIVFKDGTEIIATQNGECFVLAVEPEFPEDLSEITVESSDGFSRAYENAFIQECASIDGKYWFAILEKSALTVKLEEFQTNSDMLTECILEMSEVVYGE